MYGHYWAYQFTHPGYQQAWPTILDDTRRIIDRVRLDGTVIAGPDGYRRPVLDPDEGIEFNGDATTDLNYDAFQLLPPMPTSTVRPPTATASCRTNRNPYDIAVAAVLLRCHLLLPDLFTIDSDGSWDGEWARGAMYESRGGPATMLSARDLVAGLFGNAFSTSPLRPIGR
jgi:hypothetical protein